MIYSATAGDAELTDSWPRQVNFTLFPGIAALFSWWQ